MSVSKKQKLILGNSPVFCPECRFSLVPVSVDAHRVVVRHSAVGNEKGKCQNADKLYSFTPPMIEVVEL